MRTRVLKWFGATLLTAVGSAGMASAAQGYLFVQGGIVDYSCANPGANNYYYVEGVGYDVFGGILCEVSSRIASANGSSTAGLCTGLFGTAAEATSHAARIVIRSNADNSLVSTLKTAAKSTTWTGITNTSYSVPAHGTCPADPILVATKGFGVL